MHLYPPTNSISPVSKRQLKRIRNFEIPLYRQRTTSASKELYGSDISMKNIMNTLRYISSVTVPCHWVRNYV